MIEKIMSRKIITLDYRMEKEEAAALMKKYNIGFLPIIKNSKIIGVITDRDLALHPKCDLKDIMSRKIITITSSNSIEKALNTMGEHEIKRLIVREDDRVVGIISLNDIITHCSDSEFILNILKKIFKQENNKKEGNVEIDTFYL